MAGKTVEKLREEVDAAWPKLQTQFHPDVVHAPRVDWSQVQPRMALYLVRSVQGMPWINHLAFLAAILSSTKLDRRTIYKIICVLNARFRDIFPHYQISSFEDWNPGEHFPRYMNDAKLTDGPGKRQNFLEIYGAAVHHCNAYLHTLPQTEQDRYRQWILPDLPAGLYHRLSCADIILAEQRQRRKEETDALVPHYARIRGECHLRWNQLKRLWDKYREGVTLVETGQETLPVSFSYEEQNLGMRLHFQLWDRYTFSDAHADKYGRVSRDEYRRKTSGFAPEKNHLFLEFTHAESLEDGAHDPDALLWFGDLLRYNLLGRGPVYGSAEEIQQAQTYLRNWGYGEEGEDEALISPFHTGIASLLNWPKTQHDFLLQAQKRTQGLLFLIEPLYAAATFGLALLDFCTTTGARNGEVIQLSLDADCLYTLEVEGVQRFLVRLVPKGRDTVADYIVSTETRRNLERVGELLTQHYNLQPGEGIPHVRFNPQNKKEYSFPTPRPYLFQYNHAHFPEQAVNACMRFLCHGMVLQTVEGKQINLTAHMFRHAFATHLHQVEAVPLDVIAVMLHQKNVQVTAYYAAPPWQHVLATANSLLDKFATHLGSVDEAFVRAPAELQRQLEEAKAQVGSLNKIPGGDCTCHALCPISFACTGCVYNVPDPDREDEIVEQEHWALIRLDQVKRRSQGPEIVKMQALLQRCHVTRQEMQMIRIYRKDEDYVPTVTIERNEQPEKYAKTVAPQTLPRETRTHDTSGQGRRRSARQGEANRDD
jgi:hypothetical protein